MARIKRRGESGAAKNYITRTQALKKLQISLSDFRRLCILKGIYPREPTNKKKANKGSSAPTTFYYSKDILYLLHEPLLIKFREHKTFAKKLARALGRGEWALAKGLEDRKPEARLDHLLKERYPTFRNALQEMNDPLSLLALFERLPKDPVPGRTQVPIEVTAECGRLVNEWKVWAIRTHSLRKVFLSIKGIYYECEVPSGQSGTTVNVRWLEPYEFTQHVPADVDFRILLTFLDLYRTLTSFILYKLYTDENLVYPPPLDVSLDERGEGVGKFRLVDKKEEEGKAEEARRADGSKVTKKDVKKSIHSLLRAGPSAGETEDAEMEDVNAEGQDGKEGEEEFVHHPGKTDGEEATSAPLLTYTSLLAASSSDPSTTSPLVFSNCTFYLSRETSSRIWEFVIRAFGGKVVSTSSFSDLTGSLGDSITHIVLDRPMESKTMSEIQGERKWNWVQPQWVADCANRREILPSGKGSGYEPGGTLPPHLSPWDGEGEVNRPWLTGSAAIGEDAQGKITTADGDAEMDDAEAEGAGSDEPDEEEDEETDASIPSTSAVLPPALLAAAADPTDSTLLHQAELEAESLGVNPATFKKNLDQAIKAKAGDAASTKSKKAGDDDLRKIMMTGKKARLYEKMKYSNNAKQEEQDKLEVKRKAIEKKKRSNKA